MAWCTFASDDFGCDLRLVSTVDAYEIMVAYQRICGDIPRTAHLEVDGMEYELAAAEDAQMEFVRTAVREPITLPYAGEHFKFENLYDFVVKLQELVDLGYRVPEDVRQELLGTQPRP